MRPAGAALACRLVSKHVPCRAIVRAALAAGPCAQGHRGAAPARRALHSACRRLADRAAGWTFESAEDIKRRQAWVERFESLRLSPTEGPARTSLSVSYARSSGAGGQHVNTTSSKAVVRLDLAAAVGKGLASSDSDSTHGGWLLPTVARRLSNTSPYYVAASHSLQLSSSRSRSAPQNLSDALKKLHAHIAEVAGSDLAGETSDEQRKRVRALEQREKARMRKVKQQRGDVKKGRGKVSL